MRRTNNTKKIDLAVGHFYRMAEKNGKAFVGDTLCAEAEWMCLVGSADKAK